MSMRDALEQEMLQEGDDVRRVLIGVLEEEQSKIDRKKPLGIVKAIRKIIAVEAARDESR